MNGYVCTRVEACSARLNVPVVVTVIGLLCLGVAGHLGGEGERENRKVRKQGGTRWTPSFSSYRDATLPLHTPTLAKRTASTGSSRTRGSLTALLSDAERSKSVLPMDAALFMDAGRSEERADERRRGVTPGAMAWPPTGFFSSSSASAADEAWGCASRPRLVPGRCAAAGADARAATGTSVSKGSPKERSETSSSESHSKFREGTDVSPRAGISWARAGRAGARDKGQGKTKKITCELLVARRHQQRPLLSRCRPRPPAHTPWLQARDRR